MAKSYIRNAQTRRAFIQDLEASFRNMFANCRRFAWTHDYMLDSRAKLLTGKWERLTSLDQATVFGYWNALSDILFHELDGMYQIDGKWYTCDEVIGADLTSRCHHTNYHKVHVVNTETGPEYRIYT